MVAIKPEVAMNRPYYHIDVEWVDDVCVARFRDRHLGEEAIRLLGQELVQLIEADGCRKLVVSLSPLACLYSVMLGKLLAVQKLMEQHGGRLKLCDVAPFVHEVFQIAKLDRFFEFAPSADQALEDW